ncbi:MoaD/ThiS family protein [Phenylobacterium immobile]|uniref:MoaD/ThiS family protein n=1 Tax=Phenylobacterium immobile TaxID=21 RepID=UPI000A6465CE|nr:MoaD/ThiS family protein [Phenylobacterium immobile]
MARVLLFGPLADLAGWRERAIEADNVAALKQQLAFEDADLGEALSGAGVLIAVDQAIVRGAATLTSASEVAFLPPMSGG